MAGDVEYLLRIVDGVAIVAVRGSENPFSKPRNIIDWIRNIRFAPRHNPATGWAHWGWLKAAENLCESLSRSGVGHFGGHVIFTGHSLGGAVAVLAAQIYAETYKANVPEVVVFGCPKPFVFKRPQYQFMLTAYRNGSDIVTRLPYLYRSVTTPIKIGFGSRLSCLDDHSMGKYSTNIGR